MNLNQETTTENTEIPNELPQNPELLVIPVAPPVNKDESLSFSSPSANQTVGENAENGDGSLNGYEPVLNGLETPLNSPEHVLNNNDTVLKGLDTPFNRDEPSFKGLDTSLKGIDSVLNENESLAVLPEKNSEVSVLDPALIKILEYVKVKRAKEKGQKSNWKPVGIDELIFNELDRVTTEGGIPISHYCTEILKHHKDVLSMQILKNELADARQALNEAENENLRLSMDKKSVEDSEKLLVNISQSHLDSKESLQVAFDEKQAELNRANATIGSLKKGIESVTESVQESYKDYLVNILPETLSCALKDTYDEIISIVKSHKLPKDFDTVEMFFQERYQSHMELITKQQEIKKLAKSKNNEA